MFQFCFSYVQLDSFLLVVYIILCLCGMFRHVHTDAHELKLKLKRYSNVQFR